MRACETLWDLVRPCETVGDRAGAQSGVESLTLSRWGNIENPYSYVVEETYVDLLKTRRLILHRRRTYSGLPERATASAAAAPASPPPHCGSPTLLGHVDHDNDRDHGNACTGQRPRPRG